MNRDSELEEIASSVMRLKGLICNFLVKYHGHSEVSAVKASDWCTSFLHNYVHRLRNGK